jgi:DNA gyrase/topoisomerase IV subunit B
MSNEIIKLSDYSHARLRTEMYLGSRDPHTQEIPTYKDNKIELIETTWVPAKFTAFREIIDNAFDEILGHGFGDTVHVTYNEETSEFSVSDNGRGIPISYDETHKTYAATMAMSSARAGRNFKERGQVAGTNGIGASVVNFCSDYMKVDITRDSKHFHQLFEGKEELVINEPTIKSSKAKTGTMISFKLSDKVFSNQTLPTSFIFDRLYEIAVIYQDLKIYFNGKKIATEKTIEKSLFADTKTIVFNVEKEGFSSKFWLIPQFTEVGEYQHAIINRIPAFNGGAHIDAFRKHFYTNLMAALSSQSKKRKLNPNKSDIADGIMVFNVTTMNAPNFDSQSKTRLINEETEKYIKDELSDPDFFKNIIKKYPDWIEQIYTRCAERTMKKDLGDLLKESKKLAKEKLPANLLDANGADRSKCILLLAEGESAISGASSVRDPAIHGGMALRGKVLNVSEVSVKEVMDNKVLRDIMNAVGLIPGAKMDRTKLRYGKIYIAHDADPDGYNIGALLVNFFYKFWPDLMEDKENPFINIFLTPFVIAEKGKTRKYWYSDDYHLFDPKDYSGWSITRAKGLGTLTKVDWKHSIDSPKLIGITTDEDMKETLDLIFNKDRKDDRKDWIGM